MIKIMIRGDLLIYTNNGIKRIDKLTKADFVYTNNNEYVEIDEINKVNVKNTTNNSIFVGTTKDLQKLLKKENNFVESEINVESTKRLPSQS